jgi:membrane-associated phospholipid phosphatase
MKKNNLPVFKKGVLTLIFSLLIFQPAFTQTIVKQDSLKKSTTGFTKSNPVKLTSFILPAAITLYGLTTIDDNGWPLSSKEVYDWRQKHYADFHTGVDDYLPFVPLAAAYGMQFAGLKARDNLKDMTLIYGAAYLLSMGSAQGLKMLIKKMRPDGSENNSFPSAHTEFAFTSADLLYLEYGEKYPLVAAAGYATAAATGILRIMNNKHWFADVVVGAGLGMISSRLAYYGYYALFKKKDSSKQVSFIISPWYDSNGLKINISGVLF